MRASLSTFGPTRRYLRESPRCGLASCMRFVLISALAFLVSPAPAQSKLSPAPHPVYAYEQLKFDNGFQAILNPRREADYVSIRLVVGTGGGVPMCSGLPHLVEHLMFSGTTEYTEPMLWQTVAGLGGRLHAHVEENKTVYEMDVSSQSAHRGMAILHQMFTETRIDETSLDKSKNVIAIERHEGGEPDWESTYPWEMTPEELGVVTLDDAVIEFAAPYGRCMGSMSEEYLTLKNVEQYMKNHHVPQNMLFIVVGDFEPGKVKDVLRRTFGTLPHSSMTARKIEKPLLPDERSPLRYDVSSSERPRGLTRLHLKFGVTAEEGPERWAAKILASHMHELLMDRLRFSRAITYSPSVEIEDTADFSNLAINADVRNKHADAALELIENLVREISEHGIEEADLASQKNHQRFKLNYDFESNTDLAKLYVDFGRQLLVGQKLPDFHADLEAVDVELVREVAAEQLRMDRALVFVERPAKPKGLLIVSATAVFVVLGGWIALRRYRAKRRHSIR